ncbi:hypothetical protein [Shewanella dokdonensis]|uniref:HTH luxR-type domain-containing protein n=1 Tax=Shewanella dokdonensis TaxID=712036 RepID=A0ABX8DKT4_9GAMM|nr:hypothetical protein [Shewanella dokdonensis]MCL1076209.1 hypothetical protein [Shewanella dokdonensis]QVK24412.1 hypothetical protein KHX94_08010 [Shewanella dokdonensis]
MLKHPLRSSGAILTVCDKFEFSCLGKNYSKNETTILKMSLIMHLTLGRNTREQAVYLGLAR